MIAPLCATSLLDLVGLSEEITQCMTSQMYILIDDLDLIVQNRKRPA